MSLIQILIALLALGLMVVLAWLVREQLRTQAPLASLLDKLEAARTEQLVANEKLERAVRVEVAETARLDRTESAQQLTQFQQTLSTHVAHLISLQSQQIEGFAQQLVKLTDGITVQFEAVRQNLQQQTQQARAEQGLSLQQFGEALRQQHAQLSESNDRRLAEVRATLETKLKDIETNNALKLEEMRRTVDEKLHNTLEQRLGESFKLVCAQLEQVQRGLGEMQTLAAGVGDLKRVLTNIKTRGTWGEVQLGALLEQILTTDQYAANVITVPGSQERVEFAIRLPGSHSDQSEVAHTSSPVWLPIDAKFPREDYERLLDAQERADVSMVEEASRALEIRIRQEAKKIAEKYLAPPHTTDFALLFLPTEGLYAEVLRRPGLTDGLQNEFRITIAGPTTLTALLNSLQMGFRTLAIEKRSSEVWQVLGAVKTEFAKFGDVLARTKSQLETVTRSIEAAEVRTRVMHKKLRNVEALPDTQALRLLSDE